MKSHASQSINSLDPHALFPLMISFGSEPGLTFYTFPKYQFTNEQEIKSLYAYKIKLLEDIEKTRVLSHKEKYELDGLRHNSQIDPRYHNVCYGTLEDTLCAIEAATNLESYSIESYRENNDYLCDWHKCYDFESACRVDTPQLVEFIERIISCRRKPLPKPHYSDYHFLPKFKIELLPGDQIGEKLDVLAKGDRIIVVTRAIGVPTFSKWALNDILEAIKAYQIPQIEDRLKEMVKELNCSYLTFMGNPEDAPRGGTMVLIIYIKEKLLTFAQVGPVHLKHHVKGLFHTITQDHTFNNQAERTRTNNPYLTDHAYSFVKSLGLKVDQFLTKDESKYLLIPNVPSRCIGHPDYNLVDEEASDHPLISAIPHTQTIAL